jgi:fluoroquinolone transport system permease protein
MIRFRAALFHDIHFQWRQGFYWAYALITTIYVVLLSFLPVSYKPMMAVLIVFSDPSALGFFFIGGIILLEKGQSVIHTVFVTPLRIQEYILSKVLSLSLLSLLSSSIIHIAALGWGSLSLSFLMGVFLTSCFFTLIGLGIAVRCQTLNGFFLTSMYTVIFMIPLLGYLEVFDSPLYYVLPTQATLIMLSANSEPLSALTFMACFIILGIWILLGYIWAKHALQAFIVGTAREGRK